MDGGTAVIWGEPTRAGDLAAIVRAAGVTLSAFGAADPSGVDAAALGGEVRVFDDLRATLLAEKPTVFLMAAPAPERSLDARTVNDLRNAGTRVLSCVAPAGGLMGASEAGLLGDSGGGAPASAVRLVPRVRRHPAFVLAEDVLESFGDADFVTVEAFCPADRGGLSAALPIAIDAVLSAVGTPELADAAAARHGKRIDELTGTVGALLRFPDGRAGQLTASDRAPWGWRLTLSGEGGRLTVRPSGFDWVGPDGVKRDESRVGADAGGEAGVLTDAVRAAATGAISGEAGVDWIGVLSTAEAVLLSSRTGQPESPSTIARASAAAGV